MFTKAGFEITRRLLVELLVCIGRPARNPGVCITAVQLQSACIAAVGSLIIATLQEK